MSSKVLVPFALIFVGLAALIAMGVAEGGVPEVQVHELAGGSFLDQEIKVQGLLGTIDSETRPMHFQVRDKDPLKSDVVIDVVADVTKPDTFQEDFDVAVQGRWDASQERFVAKQIFTKCPSKYEAQAKEAGARQSAPSDETSDPGDPSGTEAPVSEK